jgi:endonuclease YncB( thermonuclease family)
VLSPANRFGSLQAPAEKIFRSFTNSQGSRAYNARLSSGQTMATRDITARLKFHKDVLIRGTGFVMAVVTVCAALAAGSILRDPSRALNQPSASAAAEEGKDQSRVAAGDRLSSPKEISPTTNVSIWYPGKIEDVPNEESTGSPASPASAEEWREQEFAFVAVVDGRTFSSGGVTMRLAGLDLPPPDQVCRTLDNRLEQCAVRAATQLELLTRSRTLACRYRMTTSSEATGSCRIGARDLAERMVRTGYVRMTDGSTTVVADASRIESRSP